jgi:putative endopeptidase
MKISKIIYLTSIIALANSCKSIDNKELVSEKESPENNKELQTIDVTYLDKNIKPQEDFFLFSNGTWVVNNPVPPSESRWGSFNELELNNKVKLTEILENFKKSNSNQGEDAYILGNYYASFIDMETRNKLGITPIQEDLNKIINLKSKADIISIIAEQHIAGINSLFNFGVGQDLKNVDYNISYVGQGGLGLPNKDYYTSENKKEILVQYKKHISNIFVLLKYPIAEANSMATSVIQFETKLASIMMAPAELRVPEKTYNKYSREDAQDLFGKIDFESYLNKIGCRAFDSIIVSQPNYLSLTNEMLDQVAMEDWKNYLLWKTIRHYSKSLDEGFVNENFSFYSKTLSGKSEMKPISDRAIDEITNKDFGELLGKAFVEKYYSVDAQERVNTMVDNLLIVFKERISNLDWMSPETKKEALNKLSSIGRKLGYPSKWEDYSKLDFKADAYLANLKLESQFSHSKNLSELKLPVDKKKWGMPAHMVNAYYHPLLNEIAFPAGIMQAPFFNVHSEDAVNYGRIGMVIGHEFTHGFDDSGSKFAADGTFKNWWSEEDKAAFEKKTGILGQTFSSFCPIEGHCVNPDLTMGENIADLGGLTMAYYAYSRTAEFKSGELREGYTPAQRFFISYAQLWKINYTDEEMKNRIANDSHSPGMYRVNGPLMNCPEFFEAFSVIEGDVMRNSVLKVARIW